MTCMIPLSAYDVRPNHMCTIDLDAFSHRGGYRVLGDIAQCIA